MNSELDPIFPNTNDFIAKGLSKRKSESNIHIRIQQRNGRKKLTTIQGLEEVLDKKKILKALKHDLSCNGTIIIDKVLGSIIQLQGDHRLYVVQFLKDRGLAEEESIVVHGA